jgi:O-antigen ligase
MTAPSGLKYRSSAASVDRVLLRFLELAITPLRSLLIIPTALFLFTLTAMLLRPPDVAFYEIDRVAFVLLILSVIGRTLLGRERFVLQRASWPMIGLTLLAVTSVAAQPFDAQSWSLVMAKFIVPFVLFHLSGVVFCKEHDLRQFETFGLIVLAYLSFTAIAFLFGAKALIFPRFILDESLGYHMDRARGPFLQAVANGVSLNLLGLLALHAYLRRKIRKLRVPLLLASLPVAILATMTRAVWLSFFVSVGLLIFRSNDRRLRRICIAISMVAAVGLTVALSFGDLRRALTDRLEESGPVDFREAVYTGGWQMFLEKPLTGWGVNQMPAELARHVSGYKERELYPHNTYLELLVEHGIVGLALYAWLIWELMKLGRGARSTKRQRRDVRSPLPFHMASATGCVSGQRVGCRDELSIRQWPNVHTRRDACGATGARTKRRSACGLRACQFSP